MESKLSEATKTRTEADRLLDAPLVSMDLNYLVEQLRNEASWKNGDRSSITIYKSESMRMVLIGLHQKAELKAHTANGTISVQVLEGHIKFVTEQKVAELEKGQMLALKKQIPHSVLALKETFFLLTMSMVS